VLARDLHADTLVIATATDAVYLDWGTKHQRPIRAAHPDELGRLWFPAGSMGPKVEAAVDFARTTGKEAVIGALGDLSLILNGTAGTRVSMTITGIAYG
jgi:carbamate kinase